MPKDWDIDRDKLQNDILKSQVTDSPFSIFKNIGYVKHLYERSYKFRVWIYFN